MQKKTGSLEARKKFDEIEAEIPGARIFLSTVSAEPRARARLTKSQAAQDPGKYLSLPRTRLGAVCCLGEKNTSTYTSVYISLLLLRRTFRAVEMIL